jgi:hypothetical protein
MQRMIRFDICCAGGDDPSPLATLEMLEQHLADLQAMPDFVLKESMIDQTAWYIAQKKKSSTKA